MAYGNIKHPPIFEKRFDFDLTTQNLFDLLEKNSIKIGKVYLRLKKVNRKKDRLDFIGELAEISVSFFEELKNDGWVFDEEAAKKYGFPCDNKNKELQEYIKKSQAQNEKILEIINHSKKPNILSAEDQTMLDEVYLRGERTGS